MSPLGFLFFLVTALGLLCAPRKWVLVPFLAGVLYMTHGQKFEVAGINLPIFRLLLAVGLLRIIIKGEGIEGGMNVIDKIMIAFFGWMFFASFFHESGVDDAGPVFIIGQVAEIGISYLMVRCYCRSLTELYSLASIMAYMLVPVALEMIYEELTGRNMFSAVFGGVSDLVVVRDGELRARGPFRHAILAGTVGASLVPLMIAMWRSHRKAATIGLLACLTLVIACSSSGPVLSLVFGLIGVFLWKFRPWMPMVRWGMLIGYLGLTVFMKQPAYFIIAKMSMGGSTGWHRSKLIDAAVKRFDEWWLIGTDYTRAWMPTGLPGKSQHTDITNYYLGFGVKGGILAIILMLAVLWIAFKWVGDILDARPELDERDRFMIWCMGASLFSHVATSVSVAYYDQSLVFFWFSVASISSLAAMIYLPAEETDQTEEPLGYDMPRS
ncbi:hypothetical protein OKA05_10075 [Luteolibacter arcticus]|uniref:Uncharacterized protein n=1 Tax=Luteolibacter arcticus TaxID=1581411 RepID=A0ABT3GH09_9BACT|nr:hypothetical protein [Luteolibacter arcticus]MCW1922898.1 hypothetical protein [Luteolibacter arcticus]